jgi:pimeloyl-ACP methyl ester carboxylesterase
MRTELELRYNAENLWVTSADKTLLDAMFIKAENEEDEELVPTVVFCNSNVGYYEYTAEMQDQWIKFYLNNGINVLLWNYRGYGRSKGSPTAVNVVEDTEAVLQFLKEMKSAGNIILHGEYLGGTVAVNVAARKGCEVLFADRAFSNLDAITEVGVGPFVASLMKKVTGWQLEATNPFLKAQCYKVIGSDPSDVVVPEVASLKYAIAEKVLADTGANDRTSLSTNELYVLYKNLKDLYTIVYELKEANPKLNSIKTLVDDGSLEEQKGSSPSVSTLMQQEELNIPKAYAKFMRRNDSAERRTVFKLACRVYDEIEKLDSAGLTIGQVMSSEYKIKLLQAFFTNIDVWGSHHIIKQDQSISTLQESRFAAHVS